MIQGPFAAAERSFCQNPYGKFVRAIPTLINRIPAGNLFCKENRKSADIASSGPIPRTSSRKEVIETIPDLWPEGVCSFFHSISQRSPELRKNKENKSNE